MPFGISVSSEEFQRRLDNALKCLNGVEPIFDDILLYGVGETDAEALNDYDTKLRALFQRCSDKGIKLKKEKLKLRCSEVSFMGHTVSKDGLKPDPAKLQGIQEMPSPQNKQDVKRFLRMINYLQRYAPSLGSPQRNQSVLLGHPTRATEASTVSNKPYQKLQFFLPERQGRDPV